jgi:hypothetical protein
MRTSGRPAISDRRHDLRGMQRACTKSGAERCGRFRRPVSLLTNRLTCRGSFDAAALIAAIEKGGYGARECGRRTRSKRAARRGAAAPTGTKAAAQRLCA